MEVLRAGLLNINGLRDRGKPGLVSEMLELKELNDTFYKKRTVLVGMRWNGVFGGKGNISKGKMGLDRYLFMMNLGDMYWVGVTSFSSLVCCKCAELQLQGGCCGRAKGYGGASVVLKSIPGHGSIEICHYEGRSTESRDRQGPTLED